MKNTTTLVIIAVLLVGVSFFGGMKYGQNKTNSIGANFRNANGAFVGQGTNKNMRAGIGNGFTGGQIISKDATSLTISQQGSGSKIILYTNATLVQKTVAGSLSDLKIGEQVTVTGSSNTDGSVSAQSIQIRPATTTRMMQ